MIELEFGVSWSMWSVVVLKRSSHLSKFSLMRVRLASAALSSSLSPARCPSSCSSESMDDPTDAPSDPGTSSAPDSTPLAGDSHTRCPTPASCDPVPGETAFWLVSPCPTVLRIALRTLWTSGGVLDSAVRWCTVAGTPRAASPAVLGGELRFVPLLAAEASPSIRLSLAGFGMHSELNSGSDVENSRRVESPRSSGHSACACEP